MKISEVPSWNAAAFQKQLYSNLNENSHIQRTVFYPPYKTSSI